MSRPQVRNWLTVVAAHPRTWGPDAGRQFREGVSGLVADVEARMRAEHPSVEVRPFFPMESAHGVATADYLTSCAFGILDVSEEDPDIVFLTGMMRGAKIPYVAIRQLGSPAHSHLAETGDARVIVYNTIGDLCHSNSMLHRELSQGISQARILEGLVYEVWFPRDTSTIWVVCPQIHNPGEFADPASPDYTYLDNLGDTDALLEILVFLSRCYPRASIEKFTASDLPRDHVRGNLVVVGGPGSSGEISNGVCLEMMTSVSSRVSYSDDCEEMIVTVENGQALTFRAELNPPSGSSTRPTYSAVRGDYGYFARFPNPLDERSNVVLVNGIHTAGVLGAARAFADRQEALRNYDSVSRSGVDMNAFECHFEVAVVHGDVRVPTISTDSVFRLGRASAAAQSESAADPGPRESGKPDGAITLLFVAGDRGGSQRNLIQIPREFEAIKEGVRGSTYRELVRFAPPILAVTPQTFVEAYRDRPSILHFAGHGDQRSLSFVLDQGLVVSQTPALPERLSAILRSFPTRVSLCVLNACESAGIARRLRDDGVVDAAVGWPMKVDDGVAIAFARTLYRAVGDGLSLSKAVQLGVEASGADTRPELYPEAGANPLVAVISTGLES